MPSEGVDALRGLGEIWTATKEWLTAWEHYWMTADEFIEAGDRVVVLMRIHARAHAGSVLEQRNPPLAGLPARIAHVARCLRCSYAAQPY